jgi:tetratricopeptide (TPR) repeat protein
VAHAQRLLSERNYEKAIDELTAALDDMRSHAQLIQLSSPDADVLFLRGVAYLEMGFPDTAAADFSEVLRIRRDDGDALTKRGEAHVLLGDFYRAVRDCTDAIRHKPDNADAYRFRGEAYYGRGQFERAVVDLEHAVSLEPALEADLRVRELLARCYRNWSEQLAGAGETAAAEAKLARARTLAPAEVQTTAPPDVTVDAAEAIEQTVAKQIIDEAQERYDEGVSLLGERRYDDALAAFTAAIEGRGDFAAAYLRRAETLMAMDFPDTAVIDLDQALHLGAGSLDAHRLQAEAYMRLGSPHRAVQAATDALHADPADAKSYALRGTAYVDLRKWDRGIADLEEAVRRDSGLSAQLQPALERAYQLRDAAQRAAAQSAPARVEPAA